MSVETNTIPTTGLTRSSEDTPLTMSISALDSRIFRNLFGTQEIRDIFNDEAYVKYLIHVEAALARAQSKTGVIPEEAGKVITDALDAVRIEYA